jgi:branched-chain amino acid transport system substrate-binding protein
MMLSEDERHAGLSCRELAPPDSGGGGRGRARWSTGAVVRGCALAAAGAFLLAACSSSSSHSAPASSSSASASAPGVSATRVLVGVQVAETGFAGPEFDSSLPGALARIDVQNARGGVDGRKIVPVVVDEGAAGALNAGNLAAARDLVGKGVFGIIMMSPFTAGSAPYLHDQGVPVAGMNISSEYGEQPYTNFFGATGSIDPGYPVSTVLGKFMKALGVTDLGSVGYTLSASSEGAAYDGAASAKAVGIKGVALLAQGFGGTYLTPVALSLKRDGVDGLYGTMDQNSNFALLQAAKQVGIAPKAVLFPTGSGAALEPANNALAQGVYFEDAFVPPEVPSPATAAYLSAMARYEPSANPYRWATEMGWLSASVFIKGLEVAGPHPTRASFIANLRQVTAYTAGGLEAAPVDFKTDFGSPDNNLCLYFVRLQGTHLVPYSDKPICGTPLPNSNQLH